MDDREKREERKRVFEDRMIDLLQAEALAMALDGPLNEWRSGLDSLGSLGKDERELLCKAIIEKCGIRGAVMLTMALLEYMLERDRIAFCPDDRTIWTEEGTWEIDLPEERDNCG